MLLPFVGLLFLILRNCLLHLIDHFHSSLFLFNECTVDSQNSLRLLIRLLKDFFLFLVLTMFLASRRLCLPLSGT